MRRLLAVIFLALATALPAAVPEGTIEDFVAREMPASGAPGLAYAIVDGAAITSRVRGEIVAGSGRAVTPDTPFLLGSISKSFTAMAVMQLVEAGKVDLDGAISAYLPVFRDSPGAAITIRQLLSHTSGYSTLQGNQGHRDGAEGEDALARQVARIASWAPEHAPGTRWEYSNANYQLLGELIETVSGERYARYIEAHILRPIGMAHSFVADGQTDDRMARGHLPWFFTKRALPLHPADRVTAPAGGVIASAGDVARYLAVMVNGRDDVLSAGAKAAMLRPASDVSPFYGLGWFLDSEAGTAWHTGSSPGVETLATMLPAEKKAAVILVNAGSGIGFGETWWLRDGIAARALGLDAAEAGGRWPQKALFVSLCAAPFVFLLCIVWAWFHRAALRAKAAHAFGRFSLWFPLVAMLAMAGFFTWGVPILFSASIATLRAFAPDLVLLLAATAGMGVLWAVVRLGLAYGGSMQRV